MRVRKSVRPLLSVACLERGEIGLDGNFAAVTRCERRSNRWSCCRIVAAAIAGIVLLCFVWCGARGARAHAVSDAQARALRGDISSGCTHFRSDWMTVVAVPDLDSVGRVMLTSPVVISYGGVSVETLESTDNAQCPNKKIRRSRRTAVTIQYTPLDLWPWGPQQLITLDNAAAVCAQHAIEDFDHHFSCSTV
jgi:hypothetical protein